MGRYVPPVLFAGSGVGFLTLLQLTTLSPVLYTRPREPQTNVEARRTTSACDAARWPARSALLGRPG
jgi:hypothetical protein